MDKDKIRKLTETSLSLLQTMYLQAKTIEQSRKFLDTPFEYVEERDGKKYVVDTRVQVYTSPDGARRTTRVPVKSIPQKEQKRQRETHKKMCEEMHRMIIEMETQQRQFLPQMHEVIRVLHAAIFDEEPPPKLVTGDEVLQDLTT